MATKRHEKAQQKNPRLIRKAAAFGLPFCALLWPFSLRSRRAGHEGWPGSGRVGLYFPGIVFGETGEGLDRDPNATIKKRSQLIFHVGK
jgi:hypothetical protein